MNSSLERVREILEEIQVSMDWGYEIKRFILNESKYKDSIRDIDFGYPIEFDSIEEDIVVEIFGQKSSFFLLKK